VLLAEKGRRLVDDQPGRQRLLDQALQVAEENLAIGENLGLLYSRFDAHRCLAEVRVRRGELDEAERLCAVTSELISGSESRVSHLWLGPLYMDVLLSIAQKLDNDGKSDSGDAKRQLARTLLKSYQQLVAACQSPGFSREAVRLAAALES
jgi:hypothetical protein